MGGAFWAGLAAGADTLGKGINTIVEDNKEKEKLLEQRTYDKGLLDDNRTYEDTREAKLYARNRGDKNADYTKELTDKRTDAATEFGYKKEGSKLEARLRDVSYSKQKALDDDYAIEASERKIGETKAINKDNLVLESRKKEIDQSYLDNNKADAEQYAKENGLILTGVSSTGEYTFALPKANKDSKNLELVKGDDGQLDVVDKENLQITTLRKGVTDPIQPLDDTTRTRLISQFKNSKTGEWNNDFEDMIENVENWWPKRTDEDKMDIPSAVMGIVRLQIDDNVDRRVIWDGIPEKYRSAVWPGWKKGDLIPILKPKANSNQTTGGRSAVSNRIAEKMGNQ